MKILIIEDEVKIATLLKRNLESVGKTAEMSHNGKDGLSLATNNNYDFIILDIMLPGINGFQVARSLRAQNNKTPIIMLTARDTADDKAKSFTAGANIYMVKPVNFNLLLSRMDDLVALTKNGNTRIFSRKEDFASPEISTNENLLPTTHKPTKASQPIKTATHTTATSKKPTPSLRKTQTRPTKNAIAASSLVPNNTNSNYAANPIEVNALNKSIMDYAPMSIITINKDGFITSANKYFKKISKTQKFKNHNVFASEFFIRENLTADFKNLLTNGALVSREYCYEKNSRGEDKYLKIIATPIFDSEGNIDGALSMAIENTEEVLSKNKLISLNNSLEASIRERTAELNEANEELSKVLRIKSAFAADVSHEIRTSLTIIQGNLELMTRIKAINNEGAECSNQILLEINRMSDMLTDLTSLTNADAAQKLNFSQINLSELIETTCNSLKILADKKNIAIIFKKNISDIKIIADKGKLEELLLNLIRNAIKYNKIGGWIKISTKETGGKICIKVADNGIGMPKKQLPFIFERFYRIDSTRTRDTGGSGLGLAICKWIAEIHGGKIKVSSEIDAGSVFTVYLPTKVAEK